jgi:hypothetical protein
MLDVHTTNRAKICNHSQVADLLDKHGWNASKLWNVANRHSRKVWDETGEIPDYGLWCASRQSSDVELVKYCKTQVPKTSTSKPEKAFNMTAKTIYSCSKVVVLCEAGHIGL